MRLPCRLPRVGLLAVTFAWLLPFGSPCRDAHSMTGQSEARTRQRDSSAAGSDGQPVEPPKPLTIGGTVSGGPIGPLMLMEQRDLERRLGYKLCDERWLRIIVEPGFGHGGVAAEIVSRDRCVNLGVGVVALAASHDSDVRARAAIFLGSVPIPGAGEYLRSLLRDPEVSVGTMALRSLCRIDAGACLQAMSEVLASKRRDQLYRTAQLLENDWGPGLCERGWGYELHVEPVRDRFRVDEAMPGTISFANNCTKPVVVIERLMPAKWWVRFYGQTYGPDLMRVWMGDVNEGIPPPDQPPPAVVVGSVDVGVSQSYSKPIDLATYLRSPDGTMAAGCYGVTFWYKDRAADFMDAPGRLQMALVSKEMRICVTDGK